MTREELIYKKHDLLRQVDAIDQVLAMFPDGNSPVVPHAGRYTNMSLAKAMVEFLAEVRDRKTVSEIAKGLVTRGAKSSSPNFTTMISSIGNRLVKEGKLVRTK